MKKIYYNGDFITLEDNKVEAILIEGGKIKKIGSEKEVLEKHDKQTELINLEGKTMMPSFIDAHSHFSGVANNYLKVNLDGCNNFKEIQKKLIEYKEKNNIDDNEWILANGYDDNNLDEKKHPKKEVIDDVIGKNPVVLQHKSGHVGVFNSRALEILNVTNRTREIEGGKIEKIKGEITGYMEENSFLKYLRSIPILNTEKLLKAYEKTQDKYLSYGITTIQEGMAYLNMTPFYKQLIKNNKLKLDLISYIEPKDRGIFFNSFKENIRKYENNFKIGGYKIFLDGSLQGRTAWLRKPYIDDNKYFGYGTMKTKEVEYSIKLAKNTRMQLLAHCNGDKAAEQYIDSIKKYKEGIEKIRPVMIHAQLLGIDQIEEIKNLSIIPSFFIAHVFYWGDTHIKNLGYERASKISPANTTLKKDVLFTFHQDPPVIEPNMFETIWCAVKRKTKKEEILGEDERITVLEAIKAVTINSAYQYFEENEKGSIKEGKIADLIIIDKNPLKVNIDEIKDIKVLETIRKGETLFKRG